MIADLSDVATDLVALIKAQELEKARQRVQEARRSAMSTDLTSRQQTVHGLTLALVEAKEQRGKLLAAVDGLPDAHRLLARGQVEKICHDLFDEHILSLQARKRHLSRPPR